MGPNDVTYMDQEEAEWLDLGSDGECESVVPVVGSGGRLWGQESDDGWGNYSDGE